MRTESSATDTALQLTVTEPTYLVYLGFETPIRLSTRGNVDFQGEQWLEAGLNVSINDDPSLRIFNEATQLGQIVLTEGTAGRDARVYQFYGSTGVILRFDGEMGAARVSQFVTIRLKRRPPNSTPRDFVEEPVFSHLPAPGTRIVTPKQTVIIE